MTRVLLDINVVLDVLLDRKSHFEASAAVWIRAETGGAEGLLSAHAVTTIYYLIHKELGSARAKRLISEMLKVFGIAPVDGTVIQEALLLPLSDFEDAVTSAAARHAGCHYIITRDPKGFRGSTVRCLTPEAVMPLLNS